MVVAHFLDLSPSNGFPDWFHHRKKGFLVVVPKVWTLPKRLLSSIHHASQDSGRQFLSPAKNWPFSLRNTTPTPPSLLFSLCHAQSNLALMSLVRGFYLFINFFLINWYLSNLPHPFGHFIFHLQPCKTRIKIGFSCYFRYSCSKIS